MYPPASHHYQVFTMRRASTTPTYPNAPIPYTTHTSEHGATQQHSDGNIVYVFGSSKTRVTNNNQTHAHPCKQIALDLQMQKNGLKLHQHHTSTLTRIETESANWRGLEQCGITCTSPPGSTLAPSLTNDPTLLISSTTCRSTHTSSPSPYPIITT